MGDAPERLEAFVPPRGSWEGIAGTAPRATWYDPAKLTGTKWAEASGKIILGRDASGRKVAYKDDRHMVTIAGTRAGKTETVLIPNLKQYPGSVIAIDPKGELAERTAADRFRMGQEIRILDPFGEVKRRGNLRRIIEQQGLDFSDESASFNALEELGSIGNPDDMRAEAGGFAESLIVTAEGQDPHWSEASRKILQTVCLHLLGKQEMFAPTLQTVTRFFASTDMQTMMYNEMALNGAYDNLIKDVAATNKKRMSSRSEEYPSIISNGDTQLAPLGDLNRISQVSDFSLADLKRKKMTIYLVLPASKMGSHYRWLRLIITLALSALEREQKKPEFPVLFLMEEFASLGYMRPIERAAGYIAGFGVRLWSVLQDLSQLEANYPKSWETFLGNAGMIQVFGLNDGGTEAKISERLGRTQYEESDGPPQYGFTSKRVDLPKNKQIGPLLEPHEVRLLFSRDSGRQIILIPDEDPIALFKLPFPPRPCQVGGRNGKSD